MSEMARTPKPPYYAVIFTSERTEGDRGYAEMAEEMVRLASVQPGFLGVESAREGLGITVSYWETLESIQNWKQNERHLIAQSKGKSEWYLKYKTRICKVERDYEYEQ
ncbi:antibiotic biosynthesis monooxygenase [Paenibacillus motobuensis]|uniref:antibiotic biosynthesis monooxygenase family protein n=1 Tax=Paenibacillus TaxID=44249 RepID=UPI00203B77F2|nr:MULTISPECIES: antibiotic biosynthesis monooxygenase [Paenibacillus]MCM3042615.1 antibiotic biosynthesis monooxygenase [Paenibacillus lutimineralis]MCM3649719.1 antibiotic biosynthesis monooxygenase [Paenibacillus motobuensis]